VNPGIDYVEKCVPYVTDNTLTHSLHGAESFLRS